MNTKEDKFEHYEELPQVVRDIISRHDTFNYETCERLIEDLNKVGYSCEYGLDAIPFNLYKCEYDFSGKEIKKKLGY